MLYLRQIHLRNIFVCRNIFLITAERRFSSVKSFSPFPRPPAICSPLPISEFSPTFLLFVICPPPVPAKGVKSSPCEGNEPSRLKIINHILRIWRLNNDDAALLSFLCTYTVYIVQYIHIMLFKYIIHTCVVYQKVISYQRIL